MDTIFFYAVIAVIIVVFAMLHSAENKNGWGENVIIKMPKFGSKPKPRVKPSRSAALDTNTMSKMQKIEPITEVKSIPEKQELEKPNTMNENISILDLAKDPIFRWAVLCILLVVLIYCLWPRGEYVSMGNSLILNKRTGEVHRACDRIKK